MTSKAKLLYSKSKVYVHPTPNSKDNIPGFVGLVRPSHAEDSGILVAWVPEDDLKVNHDYDQYVKVDLDENLVLKEALVSTPPPSSFSSYGFSVPIRDIYSIYYKRPSLGWWWGSITINTRGSETLPAIFFHDSESPSTKNEQKKRNKDFDPFSNDGNLYWGGDTFLLYLEKYAKLVNPSGSNNIFLVNPTQEDLDLYSNSNNKVAAKDEEDPFVKVFNDVKWKVLSKLASVTKFSRNTAQQLFDSTPPKVKTLLNIPEVQKVNDDFGSAKVYLAKWALGIAEEAQRSKRKSVYNEGYRKFLKGELGDFELLSIDFESERRNPIGIKEWNAFFDPIGHLVLTVEEVKERIFHGGLQPEVRPQAWLFLLEIIPWVSTDKERKKILNQKRHEYNDLKKLWWDDLENKNHDEFWLDQKSRIEKDVHRTDRSVSFFAEAEVSHPDPNSRFAETGTNAHLEQMKDMLITYNEYNKNLGYIQGMSDLLSPLYVVFQDDAVAFAAFCKFMDRMERNFIRDQSGMRDQLLTIDHLVQLMLPQLYEHLAQADSTHFFFFFRMILVWFKREFAWDDVLTLWEVLWTNYYSSDFVLFVALAILDKHKDIIMTHLNQFDEILKYMNELSMTMDLKDILERAEIQFLNFRKAIDMVDRKRQDMSSSTFLASGSTDYSLTDTEGSKAAKQKLTDHELPNITRDLRNLLSKEIVIVKEVERDPDVGGG
ncbi:GTPase activating protein [Nadsonia fulvescens var. elongata DSM 6958]|uniref:GTPase-activating protein GYP7 n=1 Tax=Nadsonia fulvescens var. elongata DSM 6958 TaxID=857566 RepID=A0A1E3PH71_9ASCO|nr:GTPase activating protein [Nadsonia fulvescens var. elongata DSM 6958]